MSDGCVFLLNLNKNKTALIISVVHTLKETTMCNVEGLVVVITKAEVALVIKCLGH